MRYATFVMLLAGTAGGVFLLSVLLNLAARRVALRIGFVDRPGGHKTHTTAMPLGGGSAIFAAALLALVAAVLAAAWLPEAWVVARGGDLLRAYLGGIRTRTGQTLLILLGAAILHIVGLRDDRRPLGPWPKLLAMAAVALLVATLGRVRLAEFAGPTSAVILTTLWFVVIVNAFNVLDNMDGLSAGVACICLGAFAICGVLAGQVLVPALACVFLGAIAGFLVFNFPPARMFMGDAGSLVVGYMLATVSVLTTYYHSGHGTPPYALAMPLVVLAVPLYDFVSVVVLRLRAGHNPMRGDQRHFSHRLVERGLSRRMAVGTIYLATATTGLMATLLPGADLRQTLTIGAIVLLVLGVVAILESPLRKGT